MLSVNGASLVDRRACQAGASGCVAGRDRWAHWCAGRRPAHALQQGSRAVRPKGRAAGGWQAGRQSGQARPGAVSKQGGLPHRAVGISEVSDPQEAALIGSVEGCHVKAQRLPGRTRESGQGAERGSGGRESRRGSAGWGGEVGRHSATSGGSRGEARGTRSSSSCRSSNSSGISSGGIRSSSGRRRRCSCGQTPSPFPSASPAGPAHHFRGVAQLGCGRELVHHRISLDLPRHQRGSGQGGGHKEVPHDHGPVWKVEAHGAGAHEAGAVPVCGRGNGPGGRGKGSERGGGGKRWNHLAGTEGVRRGRGCTDGHTSKHTQAGECCRRRRVRGGGGLGGGTGAGRGSTSTRYGARPWPQALAVSRARQAAPELPQSCTSRRSRRSRRSQLSGMVTPSSISSSSMAEAWPSPSVCPICVCAGQGRQQGQA